MSYVNYDERISTGTCEYRPAQRTIQQTRYQRTPQTQLRPVSEGKIAKYNSDGDIIEFAPARKTPAQRRREQEAKAKALKVRIAKTIACAGVAATILTGGAKAIDRLTPPSANYNAHNHSVEQVAEWCDVDKRAIVLANGIKDENTPLGEIILPVEYSMYGDKISEIEEKLSNNKLSKEKREELEEQLSILVEKQAKQDEIAEVYVDEQKKYAYILPNDWGYMAETVKDVFGIKDGVIRRYNDLNFDWGVDGPEDMPGYYRDYTYSTIPMKGIKVPYDALGKEK